MTFPSALMLSLGSFAAFAQSPHYVLNGLGAEGIYRVFLADEAGRILDTALSISPSGKGFDASHVYWPSAVRVENDIFVYATAQDADRNLGLGLWKSSGGAPFVPIGQVVGPMSGESQIGSAHVVHDPDDAYAPFKMWFGTVTAEYGRPSVIKYATSSDGLNWFRRGTVLTASEEYESQGFQLDYVCRDKDSWRMFYSATSDPQNKFVAVEARSVNPWGPFIKKGVVLQPGGAEHAIDGNVSKGSTILSFLSTEGMQEGGVYALSDENTSERVIVSQILSETKARMLRPVDADGPAFVLRPVELRKTGISAFFYQNGQPRFLATGWGASQFGTQEYVYEGYELEGVFKRDYEAGETFQPHLPEAAWSYENPSPITSSPDC